MGHSLRGVYGSLQTWVAWGKLSSCMPSLKVTQLAAGESQFVNWLCVFFFFFLSLALPLAPAVRGTTPSLSYSPNPVPVPMLTC